LQLLLSYYLSHARAAAWTVSFLFILTNAAPPVPEPSTSLGGIPVKSKAHLVGVGLKESAMMSRARAKPLNTNKAASDYLSHEED
jgi:hypothetical protein